jgi:hypothetical protein
MNIHIANVMLHVNEPLDAPHRKELEETIRGEEGVVAVGLHDFAPSLMVVAYNPLSTNSATLLRRAADRGVRATLVGL